MDENQLNENIMLINLPSAFDFKANLGYLMREKNECMFHIEGDTITRVIAVGDIRSLVQISANDQNQLAVHFLKGTRPEEERHRDLIKAYMKEWFDLDSDLTPFYEMAKNDPLLKKPIEDFYGLRHVGIPDLFEALCWGVIGQQINLTYAYTLKRRFVEKFGEAMERDSKTYWMFPTFDKIAKLQRKTLRI